MFDRPPEYSADALHQFVATDDPAWDNERIAAEVKELADAKEHPVNRWSKGETMFDLDADLGEGKTVRDWLTGKPTIFEIKQLHVEAQLRVWAMAGARDPGWMAVAVASGLVSVTNPKMELKRQGGVLTEEVLQAIDRMHPRLIQDIGSAVFDLTLKRRGGSEAEKKPSP